MVDVLYQSFLGIFWVNYYFLPSVYLVKDLLMFHLVLLHAVIFTLQDAQPRYKLLLLLFQHRLLSTHLPQSGQLCQRLNLMRHHSFCNVCTMTNKSLKPY